MQFEPMRFQVIGAADGTWQWRLVAGGGISIARSVRNLSSEAQCLYEIALVMSSGQGAVERIAPDSRRPANLFLEQSNTKILEAQRPMGGAMRKPISSHRPR